MITSRFKTQSVVITPAPPMPLSEGGLTLKPSGSTTLRPLSQTKVRTKAHWLKTVGKRLPYMASRKQQYRI